MNEVWFIYINTVNYVIENKNYETLKWNLIKMIIFNSFNVLDRTEFCCNVSNYIENNMNYYIFNTLQYTIKNEIHNDDIWIPRVHACILEVVNDYMNGNIDATKLKQFIDYLKTLYIE
jgi:hypothetical protein